MADGADEKAQPLTAAEIGAMAHLYRGEVYRSTIWRTRLDTTTNWAVVTLGIALSISFAAPGASPIPLILVGILIVFFLMLEARRYRYFNVWRARCRWLETHFYVPMLHHDGGYQDSDWQRVLAEDYKRPRYHVDMATAVGRRIRRNYLWILLIQTVAYVGKLMVHPEPMTTLDDLFTRAEIGPIPGQTVLAMGFCYCLAWAGFAWWSWRRDTRRSRASGSSMG